MIDDIDAWLAEKYPTLNLYPMQKQLLKDVINGKRMVMAGRRGGNRALLKLVFDYIMEKEATDESKTE